MQGCGNVEASPNSQANSVDVTVLLHDSKQPLCVDGMALRLGLGKELAVSKTDGVSPKFHG